MASAATNQTRDERALETARLLTEELTVGDLQLNTYGRGHHIKKGSAMVARGDCLYVNGKGAAFLLDSFRAYRV